MSFDSITVVVPCHNAGDSLRESVSSVLELPTRLQVEVIIVDDASSDIRTIEAANDLSNQKCVRLIRNGINLGVQRSRNIGLEASRTNLVLTLDADDKLLHSQSEVASYFDEAADILERDLDVAFVHTRSTMFGDSRGLTISSYPSEESLIVRKHHVPTSIIYRRSEIDHGSRYDETIRKWQDWSFGVEILSRRWSRGLRNRVAFYRGPAHGYRIHQSTGRVSRRSEDELDMVRITVERHWEYFSQFYRAETLEGMAKQVLAYKPDRFFDLLYMAAWDLDEALTVAKQREYSLVSNLPLSGIP
jgi:glycosyltransferase involved in cell wall biosynthesis